MQTSNSPDRQAQQHKLLAYLDQFGKQISSRKNNNGLEEQLSSLSRAYNQAQQKLLETERALMGESILVEKQRSVIDIYKHIIREDMEDDGILQFVQDLEENEEKKDIYEELESIRMLLSQKKRKQYQRGCQGQRTIRELRKEVSRLHEQRSCFSDQSTQTIQENQQLKRQLEVVTREVDALRDQNLRLTASLEIQKESLVREKQNVEQQRIQIHLLKSKQEELRQKQQQLTAINRIISSTLDPHNNKENVPQNSTRKVNRQKNNLSELENKLGQLVKYKAQYKKLRQNNQHTQFLKKQVSLLKLFISEEALQLFKQFEQKKLECIESQLRNLAVIEKNNAIRMQECQREVWKYKLQLMRDDDSQQTLMSTSRLPMYNSVRSQPFNSKMGATMVESLPPVLQVSSRPNNISQFMPEQ